MKSALVTGASRGIGLGIATRFATRGYGLTISARDPARLNQVSDELSAAGAPSVVVVPADMADPAAPAHLVAAHDKHYRTMNIAVLSAGVGTAGRIENTKSSRVDKMIDVNVKAPLAVIQSALPLLRAAAADDPAHGARIVALASITGVFPEAGLALYGATKAALISLVTALNAEESAAGVTATAIAPGYVDTAMSEWVHDRINPATMIQVNDIVEIVDALVAMSAKSVVSEVVISRAGSSGRDA
jgi:3-oxoacyl-[acyl-carrier protein] reductase